MSDYAITAFFRDADQPEARSLFITPGVVLPLRLDEWAKGAVAFVVTVPPNTVTVPEALLQAVRDADAAFVALAHRPKAPAEPEAAASAAVGWDDVLDEQMACADARLALANAILAQLEPR